MIAPTPYFADRGCHVRIYEEARALRRLGHDVRIVTYHLGRDMEGIPTYRIPSIPWYRKLAAGPSWHKPYLDILLFFKALRVIKTFKPHLLHAHLHEGAFVGLFLKKFLRIPLLFDCQGSLTGELVDHKFISDGSLLYRFFAGLETLINKGSDFIITSSCASATDLQARWKVPSAKVEALIDAVDTEEFVPGDRSELRKRLSLPIDGPVVAYLGVMNKYQGVDILLEVVRILKERGEKIHFLVMGFPHGSYEEKSREMGISDSVTFTGRVDYGHAPSMLAAADLAVSLKLSKTEANGKLFNYMACGLPSVVFDTPINREILGDTGVYAAYGDANDAADKIEFLIRNGEALETLRRQTREMAVREHSWSSRGKKLVEIYGRMKIAIEN